MHLLKKISVFIWFSFLYRTVNCDLKSEPASNVISRGKSRHADDVPLQELSETQQSQLMEELKMLSPARRQELFDQFQKQRRDFERSRSKWTRLRDTLPYPDELSPVSQVEIDSVQVQIRNGTVPVVRDKRTLKFLIQSLAEILGLRWTLLKYSLVVPLINNIIPAAPSPAAPAAPAPAAPPGKPTPRGPPGAPAPPGRLPPPRPKAPPPKAAPPPPRQPPPKPAPAPAPAAPAGKPAPPAARPSSPPTIPPNQIDPNTIRYPFRPAPTIPILTFAPLPPGVTVPYPPLFQWPTLRPAAPPAPAPAPGPPKGIAPQPPCAAPPAAARPASPPKALPPNSRLPLPKPRPPVPPPTKPVPSAPKGPSKTPLKLEYDHPVRIEIFNNVKPYLPASGSVYSGSPTLASNEEERETEHYENPTQAVIQAINEQYNTEPNHENRDYDYGFYTPSHLDIDGDVQTTPEKVVDYYDNHQSNEGTTITDNSYYYGNQNGEGTTALYNNYYDDNQYNNEREETTTTRYNEGFVSNNYHDYDRIETTTNRYNEEFGSNSYNDYPEQVEENRAHVNFRVSNPPKERKKMKRIRKPKRIANHKAEESKMKLRWGGGTTSHTPKKSEAVPVYGTPVSVFSTTPGRNHNRVAATIRRPTTTTTEIPPNHSKSYKRVTPRSRSQLENILTAPNEKLTYQTSKGRSGKSYTTISRIMDPKKPNNEFRIIVPSRRRRDIFFDDAFKNFNSSFESFNEKLAAIEDVPTSTQSQFLDLHGNGQLSPSEEYRQKLEKDVEKYVEQYVEQQITTGVIDPNKPKTTVIELKTKNGPPIKTVTTTLSKLVDGNKDLLESILEYSKDINPVSNISELGAEAGGIDPSEPSEVSKAFLSDNFRDAFKWDFGE